MSFFTLAPHRCQLKVVISVFKLLRSWKVRYYAVAHYRKLTSKCILCLAIFKNGVKTLIKIVIVAFSKSMYDKSVCVLIKLILVFFEAG